MCTLTKVDAFSIWKKYWPTAPIIDKISVATFLEGFHRLVSQSSPPIWLQTNHSVQVTEPPPSHTLNTNIRLIELFRTLKKLQRNKAACLDGMKDEFIFGCERATTHATIDNIQLLSSRRLSRSPFH